MEELQKPQPPTVEQQVEALLRERKQLFIEMQTLQMLQPVAIFRTVSKRMRVIEKEIYDLTRNQELTKFIKGA